MTRPLPSSAAPGTGYTRLERAVMEALAWDLREAAPDLARQFAASRPTVRRNSGFGLFTEMMVDPALAKAGLSGDFGAVHAMIAPLRDPVAFTARLQNGRLIGLMGDSYGQDTRALDFAAAPFTQVFSVDASGRSVPFQSAASPQRSEPPIQRTYARAAPAAPLPAPSTSTPGAGSSGLPPGVRIAPAKDLDSVFEAALSSRTVASAIQSLQDQVKVGPAATAAPAQAPGASSSDTTAAPADKVTLLVGAWAVIAVVAVLSVLIFDVSWPFALVVAIWVGAAIRKPKALAAIQRGLDAYNRARVAQRS